MSATQVLFEQYLSIILAVIRSGGKPRRWLPTGQGNILTMLAVIRTGGKQYLVSPEDKIKIEKIEGKEGKEDKEIIFEEVLLLEKNKKVDIGSPFIEGVKVIGKVLKQDKAKKVIIFKYKAKKRYKVKKGHRQPYTLVEITKLQITNSKLKE